MAAAKHTERRLYDDAFDSYMQSSRPAAALLCEREAGIPARLAPDERHRRCDRRSSQTAKKSARSQIAADESAPMLNARSSQPAAEARLHPATKSSRAKKVAKTVRAKKVAPVLEVCTASATASGKAGTKGGQRGQRAVYRVDIDGLRAVAVTAVIVYHVDHAWLPGGFTGVDVFFVISGYVVSGSLLAKKHQSVGAQIAAFYSRRVKRLAPALLAMVFCASLAISLFLPPSTPTLSQYYTTGMAALLGTTNVYFVTRASGGGYFDEGAAALEYNPYTHTWSLGVEEQFYLCFPLLLACAGRRPLALLCASLMLSAAISLVLSRARPTLAFYLLPSRFWQLMAGAVLLHCEEAAADCTPPAWLRCTLPILQLVACVLFSIAFTLTPTHDFPLPWSLLAVAACSRCYAALHRAWLGAHAHVCGSYNTQRVGHAEASAQPRAPPASIVTAACGSEWHADAPAELGRWSCCIRRPAIVSALFVALASAGAVQVDRRAQRRSRSAEGARRHARARDGDVPPTRGAFPGVATMARVACLRRAATCHTGTPGLAACAAGALVRRILPR